MAFTRKFLAALGIDAEKADEIMSAHVEVTEALKAQIAETKDSSAELAKVTAQLEQAKNDLKTANDIISAAEKDDYKGKYESEKAAHDKLKNDISAKETAEKRLSDFKSQAKKRGYSDKAIKTYLDSRNNYPIDKVEYDDKGNATNYDDVFKGLDEAFPDLVVKKGVDSHVPPVPQDKNVGGGSKTQSRAAEIAAKYHESLYGGAKEE